MKKLLPILFSLTIFLPSYTVGPREIIDQLISRAIQQDNVEHLKRILKQYPGHRFMINTFFLRSLKEKKKKIIEYLFTQPEIDINIKTSDGKTPIMIASAYGDIPVVRLLLQHNADITSTDDTGYTALMYAAENGSLYIVRMILKKNSLLSEEKNIINERNIKGETALWLAADKRHEKVVRLLLKYGADSNSTNVNGLSPLHLAAIYDLDDTIKLLLVAGALIDAEENIAQQTPLISAAEHGSLGAVKTLVNNGASLNKTDSRGNTALLAASLNGYDHVVKYLLEQGADPSSINSDDETALVGATAGGHTNVVRVFLDKGYKVDSTDTDNVTLLNIALAADKRGMVKLLLENSASVHSRNEDGQTPLMLATINGDNATIAMLLQLGADPHATDNAGRNALQYALQNNNLKLAKSLQRTAQKIPRTTVQSTTRSQPQASSTPMITTSTIKTEQTQEQKNNTIALWESIRIGNPQEVAQLLGKPFDANRTDEQGNTLLMNAIRKLISSPATRRIKVIETLLTDSAIIATIDVKNKTNQTALMLGVTNPIITKVLLERGADPFITDSYGNTILIYAIDKNINVTDILDTLKKQLSPEQLFNLLNQQNNEGISALMRAVQKNNPDVVTFLLQYGASPNLVNEHEQTALMLAHQIQKLEALAEEPDKERVARAEEVVQILQAATQPEIAPLVAQPPLPSQPMVTNRDPLLTELKKGSRAKVSTIEAILELRPGDLTRQRARGTTPLMIAIESNVPEKVLRFILDNVSQEHMNLKQTTRPYESALTKAIKGARVSFVRLLLKKNVSFPASDIGLAKALAAEARQAKQKRRAKRLKEIITLLENAKAQQEQERILLLAAHAGDVTTVGTALDAGVSINIQDQDGNTPLMQAIQANKDVTVRHLIEKGAHLNIQNKQGQTALMLAVQQNNYVLINSLLSHGADAKIVDNAGNTALSVALDKGYTNVANRIRIHQALQHLQKTQTITHVLRRHYDPQGNKMTELVGPKDQDVGNNPYTGRLDGTTASFFPRSWKPKDIQNSIEAILTDPEQLNERPATINADGEMVNEALIIQGTYQDVPVKVIISDAPRVGWIVFTAYPNIPRR